MSTDDRPSIAELQRIEADPTADFEGAAIRKASPVLLEIAAAALEWQDDPLELMHHRRLVAALARVRR